MTSHFAKLPLLGIAALALLSGAPASMASDFYHECGLPGGAYRLVDEALFTGDRNSEKELRYKVLSKVVLSETEGYCIGRTGRRYGFRSERYLQRIEVRQEGEPQKLDFYCEMASDGLPAGDECTKRIQTKTKRLVPVYETKEVQTSDNIDGDDRQ